MQQGSNCS